MTQIVVGLTIGLNVSSGNWEVEWVGGCVVQALDIVREISSTCWLSFVLDRYNVSKIKGTIS